MVLTNYLNTRKRGSYKVQMVLAVRAYKYKYRYIIFDKKLFSKLYRFMNGMWYIMIIIKIILIKIILMNNKIINIYYSHKKIIFIPTRKYYMMNNNNSNKITNKTQTNYSRGLYCLVYILCTNLYWMNNIKIII